MSPSQIGSFSPTDSVNIAKALSSNNIQLSPSNAKSIGAKIPTTQTLGGIASIASGLSLASIKQTDSLTLANSIQSIDLVNMNPFQKGYITTSVINFFIFSN
jgi:hypothetical protein